MATFFDNIKINMGQGPAATTPVQDIPGLALDKLEALVQDYHRNPLPRNTASDAIAKLAQRVVRAEKDLAKANDEIGELKNPTPKDARGNKVVVGEYYYVKRGSAIWGIGLMSYDSLHKGHYVQLGAYKYWVPNPGLPKTHISNHGDNTNTFHHSPKP